ncbi:NAD-dependent epimerase/dehydratase family protein [Streptomyces sp. NBC_00490]|uniref:NAD-dependent epimerase/dehydratase family protein n=1 Tax=Streptomyces sp. NBC_00490 TaxID=2903657 RepID=UPI002E16D051
MERVLVTGSNGFIGSHLVEYLAGLGLSVLAVDHRPPRFGEPWRRPGVRTLDVDLRTDPLGELVEGRDVVFHLAARPGVRGSWGADFGDYLSANVTATHRLVNACVNGGVPRLVFASSSSVYGEAAGPSSEGDACRPLSPYGVTKLAAEQLCLAYARRPGSPLSVVALRYFTVYGPRQRPDMAFSRMLFACYSGVPFRMFGDGTQKREFTYVGDVVDATVAAAGTAARDEIVNVSGGASVSLLDALTVAAAVTGRRVPLDVTGARPGDARATVADPSHARRLLDHRPRVSLAEGLARQARWLRGLDQDQLKVFVAEEGR